MTPEELVQQWHAAQPHPQAPSLTVGEYPTAVRLATILKFGSGHASPQEAANFWKEFQQMNSTLQAQNKLPLAPEEFEHLSQQMARSSYAYHGRPPSMYEVAKLRDAKPGEISDYFGALPDEHYPTVSAADMAKALHAARPWANQYVGRDANKLEGAYLHHSGQSPADYYKAMASDGTQDQAGSSDTRTTGGGNAGGQPADQRAVDPGLASGAPAPGGQPGASQG